MSHTQVERESLYEFFSLAEHVCIMSGERDPGDKPRAVTLQCRQSGWPYSALRRQQRGSTYHSAPYQPMTHSIVLRHCNIECNLARNTSGRVYYKR
jgi:hypothetical protein